MAIIRKQMQMFSKIPSQSRWADSILVEQVVIPEPIKIKSTVAILIPTYNECENITQLIPMIEDLISSLQMCCDLYIIDDNSQDGTGEIVRNYMLCYENLLLITRPEKMGIGSAYTQGFELVVKKGYDLVLHMDADLSHRPEYIPVILNRLENTNAGLAIGSRYCEQGSTKNWSPTRRLISYGMNLITRLIFGKCKIHDKTSGFRAYKIDALKHLLSRRLTTKGYAWLMETCYRVVKADFPVVEIPIVFYDRKKGQSKLHLKDVREYALFLTRCLLGWIVKKYP